jgi:hypothetical protein
MGHALAKQDLDVQEIVFLPTVQFVNLIVQQWFASRELTTSV